MRKVLGKLFCGFLALYLGLIFVAGALAQNQSGSPGPIYVLRVEASINPITKDYIINHINRANAEGASLVILELDTPGGLVSSTQDIVSTILNSKVPVAVWVGPAGAWAASAGTFITMAAHVASMSQGSTIGAAHPVNIDGSAPQGESEGQQAAKDVVGEKVTNFTAEWAREIAKVRGRDADWAEQAVRSSVTIGWEEALQRKVIDLIANSRAELLQKLSGYALAEGQVLDTVNAVVVEQPMTWREELLNYLVDPNLVYILLSLGILALTYEFLSPSIGLGFIVGGISLLLAFMGLQMLPVNYVGLGLMFFGVLLLAFDAFSPTHGILATGGVLALLIGSFTLFELPEVQAELSPVNILIVVGFVALFFIFVLSKGLLIQRRRATTGAEGMVGALGRVEDPLQPQGRVLVKGEYWFARSLDGTPIDANSEIIVEKMENGKLLVRKK